MKLNKGYVRFLWILLVAVVYEVGQYLLLGASTPGRIMIDTSIVLMLVFIGTIIGSNTK